MRSWVKHCDIFRLRWHNLGIPLPYGYRGVSCWMSRENWPTVLLGYNDLLITQGPIATVHLGYNDLLITQGRIAKVHLGYNDVLIPQGRVAISKISLYPEKFTEGTGMIDSMGPNRNQEDISVSPIVITRVDCISKISLYPERLSKGTGIIDSMGPNRNKEDIVTSRIVITRLDCIHQVPPIGWPTNCGLDWTFDLPDRWGSFPSSWRLVAFLIVVALATAQSLLWV